jgi:hypothetical protein
MQIIRFLGEVIPRVPSVTLPVPISARRVSIVHSGLEMVNSCSIRDSQIEVVCRVIAGRWQDDFVHVLARAIDLPRTIVDLIAFKQGRGLEVHIDRFIDEQGVLHTLGTEVDGLAELCTAYGLAHLDDVLDLVLPTHRLAFALHDLSVAATHTHDTRVRCGRAIDALRVLIAPGLPPNKGWPLVHDALKVDKEYLSFITGHSQGVRHGDHDDYDSADSTVLLRRSWTVMNRYLEYLKRGRKPLPESEFPLLKG